MTVSYLYQIDTVNGSKTVFEAPKCIPQLESFQNYRSCFNIVMVDVSGSMGNDWDVIEETWNRIISPHLTGTTKIYVFGARVSFQRQGTNLRREDFKNSSTNLTEAIETIRREIKASKNDLIRVFLITDGMHNATTNIPEIAIKKLSHYDKKIEVFLLGLRSDFPVEYSISIRSLLHNGNSNVPSLFWAKSKDEIELEMHNMAEIMQTSFISIYLSEAGYLCPKYPAKDSVHLGEFLLFDCHPLELEARLKLSFTDNNSKSFDIPCEFVKKHVNARLLLDKVFRQWNSIIIQDHRKTKSVPDGIFELMKDIYDRVYAKMEEEIEQNVGDLGSKSIKARLLKKEIKHLQTEFATLMNQSKTIIGLEGEFGSEMELAESILKTTVKSKFDAKNLKMKGHKLEDYDRDLEEFFKIYEKNKESIMALPDPVAEECCNVTFQSPILDLKDEDFNKLVSEDKFTFMKTFTLTGIPIFAPVKDASQINPWALSIENILVSPYHLVSQCSLEMSAGISESNLDQQNKGIRLQESDEKSLFNAIVPVFTEKAAKVLKPLIRTKLFGMLATFCILKNPHIIDMNAHMAALACCLVKTITTFPVHGRPEFIKDRIKLIEVTASIYLDRKGFSKYAEVLSSEPQEAIMTESKKFADEGVKCETLVKAIFFVYLKREEPAMKLLIPQIIRLLAIEFIGRNLAKYNEETPYSNFFVPELNTKEKRKLWMENQLQDSMELLDNFSATNGPLLHKYYKPEDLIKELKIYCKTQLDKNMNTIYTIKPCIEKVKNFNNPSSAGSLSIKGLRTIAIDLGLTESRVEEIFSEDQILVYLYHALKHNSSKSRMTELPKDVSSVKEFINEKVEEENLKQLKKTAIDMVVEAGKNRWSKALLEAHSEFVKPMSVEEMISEASTRGVNVNLSNFSNVFKYNIQTGLVRNACMNQKCPHFLIPNRSFNQHLWNERKQTSFNLIHQLSFQVASENKTADEVIRRMSGGDLEGTCGRNCPSVPDIETIKAMKPRIENLLKQYKDLMSIEEPDMTSQAA